MAYKEIRDRILTSTAILVAMLIIGLLGTSVIARDNSVEPAYTSDNLIRLHVIANSDLASDQAVKLQVRDAILPIAEEVFAGATSRDEALHRLIHNRERFLASAQAAVLAAGKDHPVRLEIGDFLFPTKAYGEVTLPEGKYRAARFVIGEGKGQNWWCVLFPPLCLWENVSAADRISVESPAPTNNDESNTWFAGAVEIRFKYFDGNDEPLDRYAKRWEWLLKPTMAWLGITGTTSTN
ncbi:MAG: stage II sporulation protein R [Firmicutes bacterium]|nr:stage II sporulation protein R [Bacillota bacterium]